MALFPYEREGNKSNWTNGSMVARLTYHLRASIRWLFCSRKFTVTRAFYLSVLFVLFLLVCFCYYACKSGNFYGYYDSPKPHLPVNCATHKLKTIGADDSNYVQRIPSNQLLLENKIMLIVETQYSSLGQSIVKLLEANRIKFKLQLVGRSLPYLTQADKGRYGVIIFENLRRYIRMDRWNRQILDKYCRQFKVGIIGFMQPPNSSDGEADCQSGCKLGSLPLVWHTKAKLHDYYFSSTSPVLRIAKRGRYMDQPPSGKSWVTFTPLKKGYDAIAFSRVDVSIPGGDSPEEEDDSEKEDKDVARKRRSILKTVAEASIVVDTEDGLKMPRDVYKAVVMHDLGQTDGIQRILFGGTLKFWAHIVLFLDALTYLSGGKIGWSLERKVLIDIDDVFVGKTGTRMTPRDVEALIKAQEKWAKLIPGFVFNLGFSGKFLHRGTALESAGDDLLIAHQHRFLWFGHLWNHIQPHKVANASDLVVLMKQNANFAQQHGIVANTQYSIAPHHSGVYPVYSHLYEAWKSVWGVRVTATEQYPHLYPSRSRRGFIYKDIMVLPRQTCGIYTHTLFLDKYPRGPSRLKNSILGGELFQTFLNNPINIFMTHMPNYGGDRLALYTFDAAFRFIHCWTNLKLSTERPIQLGRKYFKIFPEEVNPVWGNPCTDKRHTQIWPGNKPCRLPDFLIIGPQKTGTTALYQFLKLHPQIESSLPSPTTFEEVQFFSGSAYLRGLSWYLDRFPDNETHSGILFEKSATYFDSELAPKRAFALLPKAKIVVVMISPSKRAYSWYEHMRFHDEPAALNYTFLDIVTADRNAPRPILQLQKRCLQPGFYANRLMRWHRFYNPKQIHIVDGDNLRENPVEVMNKIQDFLQISPKLDYSHILKYDKRKGFFCIRRNPYDNTSAKVRCLGKSKGRNYPPMEPKAEEFLRNYFRKRNVALNKFLKRYGYPIPGWLLDELSL